MFNLSAVAVFLVRIVADEYNVDARASIRLSREREWAWRLRRRPPTTGPDGATSRRIESLAGGRPP